MIDIAIKDKKMSDEFEVRGVWFTSPKDIDNGTHGILKYSNEKIELELIGMLDEGENHVLNFVDDNKNYDVIYGFTVKGEYISLYNCMYSGGSNNLPGMTISKYRVNSFLVGGLHAKEEIIFNKSYISYTNLHKWLGKKVVSSTWSKDKRIYEIDTNELKEDLISIVIPEKGITIEEGYTINFKNALDKLNINSDRYIKFIANNKKTLEENMIEINKIKEIFTFLISIPVHIEKITIEAEGLINYQGEKYDIRTKFVYFYTQLGEFTELDRGKYLFEYKDVKNSLGEIFKLWMEKYDKLVEVHDLLTSDAYIDTLEETIFLNSSKALEVYHRTFIDGVFEPAKDGSIDEDRLLLSEFIMNNINSDNQKFFLDRINYNGETTFGNRVKQILRLVDTTTLEYLIKRNNKNLSDSKKKFSTEIYKTRNYLTHKDKNKYDDPLVIKEPKKRMIVSYQIKMIITIMIAKEIGIEEHETLMQLSKSVKFRIIQDYLNDNL